MSKDWLPLLPHRLCSPSSPKVTVTATRLSSEWPSVGRRLPSGPTAALPVLHRSNGRFTWREMGRVRDRAPAQILPNHTGRPAELAAHREQWKAVDGTCGESGCRHAQYDDLRRSANEDQIAQWRTYLRRRQAVHGPDVEELEGHLREQLAALTEAGLAGDEAFLVAVKRMGNLDALSREFARAHSERLWKQLVVASDADTPAKTSRHEMFVVLILGVAAGLAVKIPALFGFPLGPDEDVPAFYFRNASLFVFPLLTMYFMWKRGLNAVSGLWLALPFAVAAVFANAFPFHNREHLDNFPAGSDTQLLTVLHLPMALWLMAVGVAYVGGRWFTSGRRMDFVRFSGELAIYYVLIALGGGVVTAFTFMMFSAIDMNPDWFVAGWLIPCGAAGRVIIGHAVGRSSVIEKCPGVPGCSAAFPILSWVWLATMAWRATIT